MSRKEFTIVTNDVPVWASPNAVSTHTGVPARDLRRWSEQERNALGVYTPVEVKPSLLKYQEHGQPTLSFENGIVTATYPVTDPDENRIATIKDQIKAAIDMRAEAERARYVTSIWGQEVVYTDKEAEAKALDADPDLPEADTPYITAEAAATERTRQTITAEILANSAAWRAISVMIEARRIALKRIVSAASLSELRDIDIGTGWES